MDQPSSNSSPNASPNTMVPRWAVGLAAGIAVLMFVGFIWQHNIAKMLASQNAQMTSSMQQTQSQLDALKAKIDAMNTPSPAPVQTAVVKPSPVHHSVHARHVQVIRRDDPRWKQFQSRLDEQQKQIAANRQDLDSTRSDLSSARTELSGSIAKTHGELVALERKGERNYYEFDIDKTKQFRNSGSVSIRLKKANTKHQYADLDLIVDDATLSQKHVNLLQPIVFYSAEGGRPVELVINGISKNHIHGYVSEPKYKQSELTAMSGQPDDAAQQAPQRKKLELPKN